MRYDQETGQTIISGMGELHLEVIVDRMKREFRVEANVGRPEVAYKEAITHVREGGRPIRAPDRWPRPVRCRALEVEPLERGAGFEFVDKIVGGEVPQRVHRADRAGVQERARERRAGRLPGRRRPRDAGRTATTTTSTRRRWRSRRRARWPSRRRWSKATPVLLEPIMKLEISTPEEFFGDVLGDINARRGQVRSRAARQPEGHPRAGSAGGDVRLRYGPALADAGPRELQHGVRPLRGSAAQRSGEDHRAARQASGTRGV